jgi:ribonuclease H / adenosylcobalamin/alpha-ribazole phosphatase
MRAASDAHRSSCVVGTIPEGLEVRRLFTPVMATLFLVRHGSIDGMRERLIGRGDVGLNKQGRNEAARAADACRRLGVAAVASSPRRRARETAEIIAESLECGVHVVDAFDEVDYGLWSGRPFADLAADPEWRRFNDQRDDAQIPGGESLDAVSRRIRVGLETLCEQHRHCDVVVVTHAEIIRGALLLTESHTGSSWSLYQPEPASITPVRWAT